MIYEQANPKAGFRDIHLDAIESAVSTLEFQNQKGFEKYGQYLQTFTGRDTGRDLREELADANNYTEALIQEHKLMRHMLYELYMNIPLATAYIEEYDQSIVNFIVNTIDIPTATVDIGEHDQSIVSFMVNNDD